MQDSQQLAPKILVPTDFNPESERAFFHALAFAVAAHAHLTLLHTGPESRDSVPWERFPGVRETLAAWGRLPADAPRSAVADVLQIGVAKKAMRDDSPRLGITDFLRRRPTDLLVMATEGRAGLARLFHPSVADTVSYLTRTHTLMLPYRGTNLVDQDSGRSSLARVICALDPGHDQRPALAFLKQWLPALGGESPIEIRVLEGNDAAGSLPQGIPGQHWHGSRVPDDTIETLTTACREFGAQLVIVNTRSRLSTLARLRGSRNDRLMQALRIPLLAIPHL